MKIITVQIMEHYKKGIRDKIILIIIMHLSRQHKIKLLSFFPNLELSYIKNIHKKVQSDIYLTIPKGQKYFAWFKCWNRRNVCFLLKIDSKTKNILDVNIFSCVFDYSLCSGNGTVLYGTLIKSKVNIFNIEDIFYYKNKNLSYLNFKSKLEYLEKYCKYDIKQTCYKKNDIIFGLPIMDNNFESLLKNINNLSYPIYCIQHRSLYQRRPYLNLKYNVFVSKVEYFSVSPCIKEDLYMLSCLEANKLVEHNNACITNYKMSVFMNSLFRRIVENEDLDKLEESEDEEDFENMDLDKYIYSDKKLVMKCAFIPKFNLWSPIEVCDHKISSKRDILMFEKNNRR